MKSYAKFLITISAFVILSGCAGNRELIAKAGISSRQDIFEEQQAGQTAPGKAVLKIEFPVKNYKAYFINHCYKYTDPPYTVIVNIDGQTAVMSDDPVLEDLPGDFTKNPEAGTGWKYIFKKNLVLQPGRHSITVAAPLSDVVFKKEIELRAGENYLRLLPLYNTSVPRYPNSPRFSKGLHGITGTLNERNL